MSRARRVAVVVAESGAGIGGMHGLKVRLRMAAPLLLGLALALSIGGAALAQPADGAADGPSGAAAEKAGPQGPEAAAELSDLAQMLDDAEELGLSYEIYQVESGDTIENIAARYAVSPDLIRQFNELASDELKVGQSLAIPIPVTPQRPDLPPMPPLKIIEPRYAMVTVASRIITEPLSVGPSDVLYEPSVGTRVIVNAERGGYWGVVMEDGSIGWIDKSCVIVSGNAIPAREFRALQKKQKAYLEAVARAWKVYSKAVSPARDAYARAVVKAGQDFDVSHVPPDRHDLAVMVRGAYDEAVAKARGVYDKAVAGAWKTYEKALAEAGRARSKPAAQPKKARSRAVAKSRRAH